MFFSQLKQVLMGKTLPKLSQIEKRLNKFATLALHLSHTSSFEIFYHQ